MFHDFSVPTCCKFSINTFIMVMHSSPVTEKATGLVYFYSNSSDKLPRRNDGTFKDFKQKNSEQYCRMQMHFNKLENTENLI